MKTALETDVLKGVSRSFYLSLRILPAAMRRPAGIAYLLARTSDTIADSADAPVAMRLECLQHFLSCVENASPFGGWPEVLFFGTPDPRERLLLEKTDEIIRALIFLPDGEAELIREVLRVIIGGQRLDLERFGTASEENVVALSDAAELTDYAWRVAGCVGVFWTKLGYETLGEKFSKETPEALLHHAGKYGEGLQFVNILRDLPKDLAAGRCYLPVADPADRDALMREFSKWREVALLRVSEGLSYSEKLPSARLRVASALPAMIATETLAELRGVSFPRLAEGVKIPRRRIYLLLLEAVLHSSG